MSNIITNQGDNNIIIQDVIGSTIIIDTTNYAEMVRFYNDFKLDMNKIVDLILSELKVQNNDLLTNFLAQLNQIDRENHRQAGADSHVLHQYPRGPMVELFHVDRSIKEQYAKLIKASDAYSVINQAISLRHEADPSDNTVTHIELINLPPLTVSPMEFWENVFREACLHGPRMLAALLSVYPDTFFSEKAKNQKVKLMETLKSYNQ
jgi:hypothetical protein